MKKKKSTTITTWILFIIRFSFAWSIVSYDDVKYWKTKVHLLRSNIGNKKFTKNNHNSLKSLCAPIKYHIKQSLEKSWYYVLSQWEIWLKNSLMWEGRCNVRYSKEIRFVGWNSFVLQLHQDLSMMRNFSWALIYFLFRPLGQIIVKCMLNNYPDTRQTGLMPGFSNSKLSRRLKKN